MKIRIKENSIRLRLTKSEVDSFFKTKVHSQSTQFANSRFEYSLQASAEHIHLAASLENSKICIYMPMDYLEKWKDDAQVGFSNKHSQGDHELSLKVEKDFVCLDDTDEDQSDNYPNPNQNC